VGDGDLDRFGTFHGAHRDLERAVLAALGALAEAGVVETVFLVANGGGAADMAVVLYVTASWNRHRFSPKLDLWNQLLTAYSRNIPGISGLRVRFRESVTYGIPHLPKACRYGAPELPPINTTSPHLPTTGRYGAPSIFSSLHPVRKREKGDRDCGHLFCFHYFQDSNLWPANTPSLGNLYSEWNEVVSGKTVISAY
jgi:hypothetical protein